MTNWIKQLVLVIYWFPEMLSVYRKQLQGRWFYFKDESNEFLRFMQAVLDCCVVEAEEKNDKETLKERVSMRDELDNEIAMRKRQGTWPH